MKGLALIGLALVLVVPASATTSRILPSQDAWPVWSPTNARIAFTRIHANSMSLEVLDFVTNSVVRTLATSGGQLLPSWSSDGQQLAYQSFGHVWIVGAHGGGRHDLGPGLAPAWSPSGNRVAYLALRGGQLALTTATPPARGGGPLARGVIGAPAWSPDGREIAFQRADGIYAVNLDGGERRIATAVMEPAGPAWSPNGTWIAYADAGRMWAVVADGSGKPKALTPQFATLSTPHWSRESDRVVFTRPGAVQVATVVGRSSVLYSDGAGIGAAYDSRGLVAFAGPRQGCPGHVGIEIFLAAHEARNVAGSCIVAGTARGDVIEGTSSWGDDIRAGAGNDRVHADDGHTDRVDCGSGRDIVWADRADRLSHCEIVHNY